ncbi:MAG: Rrf2 family transcriptional regulator [Dethiobacteria bacterium]|nr:Rrf2 family transcriptional regulator [Bacillota bacterium]HOP68162.1 Rrf2 family transcriptional regulator [Bacillota bacterium]HPT33032.1 Rrf2 family transcriptional regulator [Bacillota bacterium]HPZ64476.1 Rrf2 family transcriptional regulator [Bacillota bacterium]HQD05264.1 Rrf2 family transcriptional regulator [Bacillota bacterium]
MQLSTKARYSARAMIELAARYGQGPTLLKDIARKQGISEKYLEQLMAPLRASGLIFTLRGNRGGYVLGRDPSEITLYEIINIVEGSLAPVPCVDKEQLCERTSYCVTREVWRRLKEVIIKELQGITLKELASKQEEIAGKQV